MERNADKVQLVSYAPLIENAHYGRNHLMVLDNKQVYGRTNYHVMKLFSENRPDVNVPLCILGEQVAKPHSPKGFIGLSTGNTAAQFRDLKVTSNGRTLYTTDWSDLDTRWETIRGEWKAAGGVLTQPVPAGDALLRLKDLEAGDCTITLKARKTAGHEGFRVVFGMQDDRRYFMADMGSHSNESVLFREIGDKGSVSLFDYRNQEPIEANRWYDVRIEIRGNKWKCYLDGELKYAYDYTIVNKHYAVAGLDHKRNELVVKLVNGRTGAVANLAGAERRESRARRSPAHRACIGVDLRRKFVRRTRKKSPPRIGIPHRRAHRTRRMCPQLAHHPAYTSRQTINSIPR